ncbi:hypothetical protein [Oceanithermus sp.]
MKTWGVLIALALSALLTACLPVASLQVAEPVDGRQIVVGLTGVTALSSDSPGAGAMPYLAYVWGNGNTEFSISTQIGLRGGVKQKVADGFSVAGGLTLPWLVFTDGTSGLPFTADVALLADVAPGVTVAGRGMYVYMPDLASTWLGGASLLYRQEPWMFEGGFLVGQDGSPLLSLSAAYGF